MDSVRKIFPHDSMYVKNLGVEYFNKVLNNEYNLRVNVQNYPTGMYFVTISNGTSVKTKQFIIQK